MTSPVSSPAFSAGAPAARRVTITPCGLSMLSFAASFAERSSTVAPSQPLACSSARTAPHSAKQRTKMTSTRIAILPTILYEYLR
jgi:hypothetical protein